MEITVPISRKASAVTDELPVTNVIEFPGFSDKLNSGCLVETLRKKSFGASASAGEGPPWPSDIPGDDDLPDALALSRSLIALRVLLPHMVWLSGVADCQGGKGFQ